MYAIFLSSDYGIKLSLVVSNLIRRETVRSLCNYLFIIHYNQIINDYATILYIELQVIVVDKFNAVNNNNKQTEHDLY